MHTEADVEQLTVPKRPEGRVKAFARNVLDKIAAPEPAPTGELPLVIKGNLDPNLLPAKNSDLPNKESVQTKLEAASVNGVVSPVASREAHQPVPTAEKTPVQPSVEVEATENHTLAA